MASTLRVEPLGRILRARLPDLGRDFLLRELVPPATLSPAAGARLAAAFQAECRALASLPDPRVLAPCDLGAAEGGRLYAAYEDPASADFAPVPPDPRALATEAWLRAACEACRALSALERAAPHLPALEPDGLYLARDGRVLLLLLDLGHLTHAAGLPPALAGPPSLDAAPELLGGAPGTPEARVFSLASWLYRMLSGRRELPPARAGREPDPLWSLGVAVPGPVDEVIRRALNPEPRRRDSSPILFAAALEATLRAAPAPPAAAGVPPAAPRAPSPEPLFTPRQYAAWAAGMAAAGGFLGWALARLLPGG